MDIYVVKYIFRLWCSILYIIHSVLMQCTKTQKIQLSFYVFLFMSCRIYRLLWFFASASVGCKTNLRVIFTMHVNSRQDLIKHVAS